MPYPGRAKIRLPKVPRPVRILVKRLVGLHKPIDAVVKEMRQDWDERARKNPRYYVATLQDNWPDEEFFESGRIWLERYVLPDLPTICRENSPKEMRMLEIGCGAGRMTKSFSDVFGYVDAIDISDEMIRSAKASLVDHRNVSFHVSSGTDLALFGDNRFDFAFSAIVFQHIPRKSIVRAYIKEVARVLRPGATFKFQIQGSRVDDDYANTWRGVGFTEREMRKIAPKSGFRIHSMSGAGTQDFWLTLVRER